MLSARKRLRKALTCRPYPFQSLGVRKIERRKGKVLLADDMGLGKTIQAIGFHALNPQLCPCLVVCQVAMKYKWQTEFMERANIYAQVGEGAKAKKLTSDYLILNYDLVHRWLPKLLEMGFKSIVLDECQFIKNPESKRALAIKTLARRCKSVLGLSGTPIENGPIEFFPILHLLAPKKFPSYKQFGFHFCDPKPAYQGRGWDFRGAHNMDELHALIKPLLIRRMKSEVLKDLPKRPPPIVVPLKVNLKEYNRIKTSFIEWLTEKKGTAAAKRAKSNMAMVRLIELKRAAARAKLPLIKEWLTEWEASGQKLVMFGIHRDIVEGLGKMFPKAAVITGKVKGRERDRLVTRFQKKSFNRCPFIFGNLHAMGTGVTLTAASTTATIELWWNPAKHRQADDRVLRIGQTAKEVTAFYFLAKGTVDERMWELLKLKSDNVSQVVDGKRADLSEDVMTYEQSIQKILIHELINERKKK